MSHLSRMIEAMKAADMEAVIVTSEINQRYLTGFAYTDGYVLIANRDYASENDFAFAAKIPNLTHFFDSCTGYPALLQI